MPPTQPSCLHRESCRPPGRDSGICGAVPCGHVSGHTVLQAGTARIGLQTGEQCPHRCSCVSTVSATAPVFQHLHSDMGPRYCPKGTEKAIPHPQPMDLDQHRDTLWEPRPHLPTEQSKGLLLQAVLCLSAMSGATL